MARLWVAAAAGVNPVGPALQVGGSEAEQYFSMVIGAASAQSAAITNRWVRLVSDINCHVAFGSNPTAVKTAGSEVGIRLQAFVPEWVCVADPGTTKLAVIEAA